MTGSPDVRRPEITSPSNAGAARATRPRRLFRAAYGGPVHLLFSPSPVGIGPPSAALERCGGQSVPWATDARIRLATCRDQGKEMTGPDHRPAERLVEHSGQPDVRSRSAISPGTISAQLHTNFRAMVTQAATGRSRISERGYSSRERRAGHAEREKRR